MQIHFILVRPQHPGNIGAAARAIKTMGFRHLRLVAPSCDHRDPQTLALAHASEDLLEGIEVYPTLLEALHDHDIAIATTVRERSSQLPLHPANELPELLRSKGQAVGRAAIVFGPENSGLSAEDTAACHLLSTIPMAVRQPPLNLAQAVMIYAYTLTALAKPPEQSAVASTHTDTALSLAALNERTERIMVAAGMAENVRAQLHVRHGLACMTYDQLSLVHMLCSHLEESFLKSSE